jgi:2-dehydro-3-deoxyphosphogluconate aldolase/(4S)-4-hydroxy-2-oxoglutarate aldolase
MGSSDLSSGIALTSSADAVSAESRGSGGIRPPGTVPAGVIVVLRLSARADAETAVRGLSQSSVDAIELTLTTPGAIEVLADLRRARPDVRLLAGTVRKVEDVRACHEAGVDGIVSPHTDPRLITLALELGLSVVPGALTPSEVATAHALGASAVKVFPVGLMGGAAYVRSVREPLPDIPLVASGGVQIDEVGSYLAEGCLAVCLGSALLDEGAMRRGDADGVAAFADARLAEARRAPGAAE